MSAVELINYTDLVRKRQQLFCMGQKDERDTRINTELKQSQHEFFMLELWGLFSFVVSISIIQSNQFSIKKNRK